MADKYDCLRLGNQLCFPLYACSKEIVHRYKPMLDELDLTYTQYITMMVMWEHKSLNVKELGEYVYLDSGTLTPLLKKLEAKGYVKRTRCANDERCVNVEVTPEGLQLEEKALSVPGQMWCTLGLTPKEAETLKLLLTKVLDNKN